MIQLGIDIARLRDSLELRVDGKKVKVKDLKGARAVTLIEIETVEELQEILFCNAPPYVS